MYDPGPSTVASPVVVRRSRPNAPQPSNSSNSKTIEYQNMWQLFLIIVALIVIFNNSMVYCIQRNFTPNWLRTTSSGNPPIIVILLNAIIIGALFVLILRFTNI
jgi:uncharacterized integral membrane protein